MTYITSLKIGFSEPLDSVSNVSINVQAFFLGSIHCSQDPQVFFYKNNFKIESHGIINTFKNYFTIAFSIFNNKHYPNRPLDYTHQLHHIYKLLKKKETQIQKPHTYFRRGKSGLGLNNPM